MSVFKKQHETSQHDIEWENKKENTFKSQQNKGKFYFKDNSLAKVKHRH